MEVLTNITLDLVNNIAPVVVHAKQYDENTRKIVATLTENGLAYDIPQGAAGIFQLSKPDGTYCYYDADEDDNPAVIIDGSTVTVTLLSQALSAYGDGFAQIDLYDVDEKLTSFTFILRIQKSTVPDDAISTDYFNVLTNLVTSAIDAATLSESWAVGGTGIREGEDTNNAKYWSEQAHLGGGVQSFNGRAGEVLPQEGDYDAEMVGARPDNWMPTAAQVGACVIESGEYTITENIPANTTKRYQVNFTNTYASIPLVYAIASNQDSADKFYVNHDAGWNSVASSNGSEQYITTTYAKIPVKNAYATVYGNGQKFRWWAIGVKAE